MIARSSMSFRGSTITMKTETLESGPVPLYYQLEQRLRERINSGEYAKGEPLPTEDRICGEFGVSRITVRRALADLQQQGLIERRRGVGSFVTDKPRGINSHLTGSLNEFLSVAGSLTTRCISLEEQVPPEEIGRGLDLEEGEKAVLMRTVGSLTEGPVAYLEIWFPVDIGSRISAEQVGGHIPVIRMVERAANVQITRAEQTIAPDHAGEQAAHFLEIDPKAPVLHVRRAYYAGNRPVELVNVIYHPQRYSYAVEYKG